MMILLILVCTHELSIGITFLCLDKLIKLICMQGPKGTPQLASQGRGVLPGIPGGVCHVVLQILTLFQTKKCKYFPHPFSDLAFKQKLCYHYSDWSTNQTILQIHFEFAYIPFFLTHLELKQ